MQTAMFSGNFATFAKARAWWRRGMLVGWNNRRPDGGLNHDTLHHAMKVRKGLKYVITKWYRERPWGW